MDDLLRDFVAETSENIDVVDRELVRFEREPENKTIVAQIFRLVHTIKGTCGFLGLPRLEALTHAAESAIDGFRDGAPVTRDLVTLVLSTIDRIKLIMGELDRTMQEPDGADQDLIHQLETVSIQHAERTKQVHGQSSKGRQSELPVDFTMGSLTYQVLERPLRPGEVSLDELEQAFRETAKDEAAFSVVAVQAAERMVSAAQVPTLLEESHQEAAQPVLEQAILEQPQSAQHKPDAAPSQGSRQHSVRVSVDRLEHLMTVVSELVLTRNQLLDIARRDANDRFKGPLQRLSQVTAELQDSVMQTRMQPIGTAWGQLPRLVRDLSQELGKNIDLETQGAETGIDRQLLEHIKDPMMHMVRNAADHGIEKPEDRVKLGKSPRGLIRIEAAHKSGYITLSIVDDGRGLDLEKIRMKAIELGLADQSEIKTMTDQQVARFIFHPGFTTSKEVTSISGRGVGMDVVRSNIEQIGGSIEINTRLGKGTTVDIKIPLTLAIAAALIVECGGQRFALPQLTVLELVREGSNNETRIEQLHQAPVLRLRERLVPLLQLSTVLGLSKETVTNWTEAFIVICRVGQVRFGIVVDSVLQTEEVVVKPVSGPLRHLGCYSGVTILGDGSVTMILDPSGLLPYLESQIEADNDNLVDASSVTELAQKTALIVFKAGTAALKAIPLALVMRLEDIPVASIERSAGQAVVRYRDRLMVLKPCHEKMEIRTTGTQPVLVFSHGASLVGIMVDSIVDIVEDHLVVSATSAEAGLLGSAIIRDRPTEILDVAHFIPHFESGGRAPHKQPRSVLLIEANAMFRAMLTPVVQAAGYRITAVASLTEATALLAETVFDSIVVNIEMDSPHSYAGLCQSASQLIGIANRASVTLLESAHDAGFHDVVGIFDREGLIASLRQGETSLGEAA